MNKNKLLCYIATLGTLLATTGCTTTYVVRDDFRLLQPKTEAVQNKEPRARDTVAPAVIEAKPLVVPPVVYAPAVVPVPVPVYYRYPHYYRPYYHHHHHGHCR